MNIKRIFILEDNQVRNRAFRERVYETFPVHSLEITDNVETAIEWLACLKSKPYDYVFLDHDLVEDHYYGRPSKVRTGFDLAVWLNLHSKVLHHHGTFIIHSLNEMGRMNMMMALEEQKRCYLRPFIWQKEIWEKSENLW